MSDTLETQLADLLRRLPDWIRRDLSASDPARRERSEEVLNAMLLALIADQSRAGPATSD